MEQIQKYGASYNQPWHGMWTSRCQYPESNTGFLTLESKDILMILWRTVRRYPSSLRWTTSMEEPKWTWPSRIWTNQLLMLSKSHKTRTSGSVSLFGKTSTRKQRGSRQPPNKNQENIQSNPTTVYSRTGKGF